MMEQDDPIVTDFTFWYDWWREESPALRSIHREDIDGETAAVIWPGRDPS